MAWGKCRVWSRSMMGKPNTTITNPIRNKLNAQKTLHNFFSIKYLLLKEDLLYHSKDLLFLTKSNTSSWEYTCTKQRDIIGLVFLQMKFPINNPVFTQYCYLPFDRFKSCIHLLELDMLCAKLVRTELIKG